MSLRVYNTLTGEKTIFQPVRPGKVGIYLCGPTVYKPPHIGHMVGPVIFDAIKRYLLFKGYEVTLVVNITDVEDKLINEAAAQQTTVDEVAHRCTEAYLECLAMLGIDTVDRFPKASDHIAEIVDLCTRLIDKGHAYPADGNVYFDVTKDPDYGKLSHRKVEEQEAGTRDVEGAGKRNPADFALWKAAKPGEPSWDSPWGAGRPGWHIECSAMSMKYLGDTLDMHGGGLDLKFPHHENELAQSESSTGKPFVKFWMHNGLTRMPTKLPGGQVKMEKQSKSLGNVIEARTLIEDLGADTVRYLLLSTHYRSPIDFTDLVVANVKKAFTALLRVFQRVERLAGKPLSNDTPDMSKASAQQMEGPHADFIRTVLAHKMKFLEMMDDDFNTAGAIAVLHELAGQINAFVERHSVEKERQADQVQLVVSAAMSLKNLGIILGLFRAPATTAKKDESGLTNDLMQLLIHLRQEARATKNFPLADAIRNGLTKIGVTLEDRAEGTIWSKD